MGLASLLDLVLQFCQSQSVVNFRISGRKSIVALESILNGEPWLYEDVSDIPSDYTRICESVIV